jgi:hypothetical protein
VQRVPTPRFPISDRLLTPDSRVPTPYIGRLAFAAFVGAAAVAYVVAYARVNPDFVSDFDQVWAGARALWRHQDPYHVVGPRGSFLWKWPLYYPLPALLVVAPLGLLSVVAARAIFAGVSSALLAWAVTRDGWDRLPLFISVPFMVAVELVQWSPILVAAALLPWLGWIIVAKPNLGAAVTISSTTDRALVVIIAGSLLLVAASFVVLPRWPEEWIALVRSAPHFRAPVLRLGGVLTLLALSRWRRPEARLLIVLACVPQTPTFYDPVLFFIIARTFRESLLLASLSVAEFFVIGFQTPFPSYAAWGDAVSLATNLLFYLPCTVLVLRRPNEGELPAIFVRVGSAVRRAFGKSRA